MSIQKGNYAVKVEFSTEAEAKSRLAEMGRIPSYNGVSYVFEQVGEVIRIVFTVAHREAMTVYGRIKDYLAGKMTNIRTCCLDATGARN